MLSLLLPRSAWRVIQRRSRTGWRQDQFLQNAEVRRKVNRAVVGLAKMAWLLTLPYSENVGVRAVACYNTRPVFGQAHQRVRCVPCLLNRKGRRQE